MGLRIYLAAPWANRNDAAAEGRKIEARGHTITEPWWNHPESTDREELVRQAQRDIEGIVAADFVIVLQLALSEGKAVETGIAMALMKPIVVVNPSGQPANLFQNGLHSVATLTEALDLASEYEAMLWEYSAKVEAEDAALGTVQDQPNER